VRPNGGRAGVATQVSAGPNHDCQFLVGLLSPTLSSKGGEGEARSMSCVRPEFAKLAPFCMDVIRCNRVSAEQQQRLLRVIPLGLIQSIRREKIRAFARLLEFCTRLKLSSESW
jgi:hypothetical protein